MKKSIHLSIPKPCHEKWNTFTPAEQGAFCQSCSKTVLDFTSLSDLEILHFIQHKPAHVCGRFTAEQLKSYTLTPPPQLKKGWSFWKSGLASMLLVSLYNPVVAHVKQVPQVETESSQAPSAPVVSKPLMTISGTVTSSEDGSALPAVNVWIKGTARGTTTDLNGNFELTEVTEKDVLVFSFIGMQTEEYSLRKHAGKLKVEMKMNLDLDMMGELLVVEEYQHPTVLQRFWKHITSIF